MPEYQFKIDNVGYYATTQPNFEPHGVQQGFTASGQPSNYGPGSFEVGLNAVAIDSPSTQYADPYGSSGTFRSLVSGYFDSLSSSGGLQDFSTFDPRINDFTTSKGRIDIVALVNSLAGGKALSNVPIRVTSAFIPDGVRGGYYGGDPSPLDSITDYIPGDDVPPGEADEVGWNNGLWGSALWNQEGV
jgi:hypothetical protein